MQATTTPNPRTAPRACGLSRSSSTRKPTYDALRLAIRRPAVEAEGHGRRRRCWYLCCCPLPTLAYHAAPGCVVPSVGMMGLLGLFFAMSIFRLILFCVTVFAAPPGLWLFPNLFEDVGFFDSFKPLWGWQEVSSVLLFSHRAL